MVDLTTLSLREKIGQMVMCGFEGTEPSEQIIELIEQHHIGGVIYFNRNVKHPQQILQLSRELQERAKKNHSVPLFISIDQEGGMVARITDGVTLMPGNMALGATRDVEGVYQAAYVCGKELRLLGINMNYAPCLDVNNNPLNPVIGVRSYSENIDLVSEMGMAAARGYQAAGVSATIKHFPGHGDTNVDSHLDLPTIPHDLERLHQLELVPFKRAINDGVDAVMTAHVVFPAFDDTKPSTLSPKMITHLLRDELKYDGVMITDCMEMQAISDYFGTEAAAVLAVEAGIDLVLVSHRFDRQLGAIQALVEAVESGRISEERINQSVERILRLKEKRNMADLPKAWQDIEAQLATEENQALARKLSEKSITLIKDINHHLPLDQQDQTLVVWTETGVVTEVDETLKQKDTLGAHLAQRLNDVDEVCVSTNPSQVEIDRVLEKSKGFSKIIVTTYNAFSHPGQVNMVQQLVAERNSDLVVVALRNPYDLNQFPEIEAYVVSYESRPLALQSIAKALLGEIKAEGRLPITITEQFAFGWSSP